MSTVQEYLSKNGDQLSEDVKTKFQQWMEWDQNERTREEILGLNPGELEKRLSKRLNFGTAGIRGAMGAGFGMMNDLVIIETSQGLAAYAAGQFEDVSDKSAVVGYDGRHNSKRFAQLTAVALLAKGFRVYLYSKLCPTPFISFGVKYLKCCVGIMITASHNPKQDNGYKVYWSNSAQIIEPHDKKIQACISDNLVPWPTAWDTSVLEDSSRVSDPLEDVCRTYNELLRDDIFEPSKTLQSSLTMTYTPMHGVGQAYMERVFQTVGLKPFISVREQMDPDPEFSTVKFPNPEEGKSALNLAIQTAENNGSTLILANDPDSDRLAVAEKNSSGGWTVFNGNEIGALLGWWMIFTRPNNGDNKNCYLLASTVSSKFLKSLCDAEGFSFLETLTGFKWMGNKAVELISDGLDVCFAYEEAIGFMCGKTVLDKDGISAAVRVATMANYLAHQNLTLGEKLIQLYKTYGYHVSLTSYFINPDPVRTAKIFNAIRARCNKESEDILVLDLPADCHVALNNCEPRQQVRAVAYRDLTCGYDSDQPDKVPILPVSKSSEMITFRFDNGLVLTIRASGTEPKLKYYVDFRVTDSDEGKWKRVKDEVSKLAATIVEDLMGDYLHELTPQSALNGSD